MSNSVKPNTWQAGNLRIWIVLVTSVVLLVALFGWVVQTTVASSAHRSLSSKTAPPAIQDSALVSTDQTPLPQLETAERNPATVDNTSNGGDTDVIHTSLLEVPELSMSAEALEITDSKSIADAPEISGASPAAVGVEISESVVAVGVEIPESAVGVGVEIPESAVGVGVKIPESAVGVGVEIPESAVGVVVEIPESAVGVGVEIPESAVDNGDAESAENNVYGLSNQSVPNVSTVRSLLDKAQLIDLGGNELLPEELTRRQSLDSLALESAKIRFAVGSKAISPKMANVINDLSDILSFYDDTQIVVTVTTNESSDQRQDLKLSQERGRAIIAKMVSKGIEFSRFSLEASSGSETLNAVQIAALPNETTQNN